MPTWREIAKLSSIRPVIAYHGRSEDFELRVVMRVTRYVPLPERVRFIRAIAKLTAARWPAPLP